MRSFSCAFDRVDSAVFKPKLISVNGGLEFFERPSLFSQRTLVMQQRGRAELCAAIGKEKLSTSVGQNLDMFQAQANCDDLNRE